MGFEIQRQAYSSSTHTRNRRQSLPCTPPDQSAAEFTYFPTTTTHSLSPPPTPTRTFPDVSNNPPNLIHLPTHYEKKLRRRDSTLPAYSDARAKRLAARKLALLFAACFTGTYLAFLLFSKRHAPPPPKVHKIVWYAAPSPNVGTEAVRAPAADRRWEEAPPYRPAARRPPTRLDGISTDHDVVRSRADAYRDAAPIIRRRAPTHEDADRQVAAARNAQNIPPPLQVEIIPVSEEPEPLEEEERGTGASAEDATDDDELAASEVEAAIEPEPEPEPEPELEPAVEDASAVEEEATVEEAVWVEPRAIHVTGGKRPLPADTAPPVKQEADYAYGSKDEYLQHKRDMDADRKYQAELARRESHDLSGRPPPANRNRMRQMNRGPPPPRYPMDSSTTARKPRVVDTGDTDPRSIPRRVMKSPSADLTAAQVKRANRGRKGKGPQRAYVPHERDAEEQELPSNADLAAAEATQRLESRWGPGDGEDDGDE